MNGDDNYSFKDAMFIWFGVGYIEFFNEIFP